MFGQRQLRLGALRQFSFSQALRQPEVQYLDLAFGRHLDVALRLSGGGRPARRSRLGWQPFHRAFLR